MRHPSQSPRIKFAVIAVTTLLATLISGFADARVFLLAGQSNMSGAGLFDQLEESQKVAPEGVRIWHKGEWKELGPGFSANTGRFGPEIAFGRAMRKAFPEDKVYFIKTAAGGTSMHKHWTVENGGGPMLKRFVASAAAALGDLDAKGVDYTIAGMLWMQGEADAAQGMGAEYEASLRAFIARMRGEFGEDNLPFLLGRILPSFDKPEGNGPLVRAAQERVASEVENVHWFDTDKFERLNKGHYNHNGQIELGTAFAKHYLKLIEE